MAVRHCSSCEGTPTCLVAGCWTGFWIARICLGMELSETSESWRICGTTFQYRRWTTSGKTQVNFDLDHAIEGPRRCSSEAGRLESSSLCVPSDGDLHFLLLLAGRTKGFVLHTVTPEMQERRCHGSAQRWSAALFVGDDML